MKTVRMLVVLIAVAFMLPLTISAQQPGNPPQMATQTITGPATYQVQPGDTVWNLSPDGWRQIKAANAKLQQPSRQFTVAATGGEGLYIYAPETLTIPAGVTVSFRHPATLTTTAPNANPVVLVPVNQGVSIADVNNAISSAFRPLYWLLPLMLLVLLLAMYLMYRALRNLINLNERNAEARQAATMRELGEMERRRRQDEVRRDGLMFALYLTVVDMFAVLATRMRGLRHDVREVHREVLETRLDIAHLNQRPQFGIVDLERALDPDFGHHDYRRDADTEMDLVTVERRDGIRLTLDVARGVNMRSQHNGVAVDGTAVFLTEDAGRRRRDEMALARREREVAEAREADIFG